MINILWSQFEKNQQAKDISFESFCFQVAYIKYKDYGFFENFYNTPGSEFYLVLHTDCPELDLKVGDEIGWQVKWWFNSEDNTSLTAKRRKELEKGFSTTLNRHSSIKLWIICTPGSFVEDKFIELKESLVLLNSNTDILHWNKETFMNFQSSDFEKFNCVYHHYFNANFIGFDFLRNYSTRRIDELQKKFDTDLYTPSHYDDEIFFVIDYKAIFEEIAIRAKYLADKVEEIESDSLYNFQFSSFDEEYIRASQDLLEKCIKVSKETIEVISSGLSLGKIMKLKSLLISFSEEYKDYAKILDKKLKSGDYMVDKNNWSEKNINNDYILPSIIGIRDLLIYSKEDKDHSVLDLFLDVATKDIHILSSAGYGKTNIACNICFESLERGIPALLILGSSFRKTEFPQKIILEQLEIDTQYTFKEFLQALNTLGFSKGVKIPIIIDGLNESKPYDDIWKSNIKNIIKDVQELDYVVFITTCRNRYIESIFEEPDISKIKNTKILNGLDDKQRLEAIPKYFKKYNINPTSWNFNQNLFINPLLLKIFSEVNKNKSNVHISMANVFDSIEEYIKEIEAKVSVINSSTDIIIKKRVRNGIKEYCNKLWDNNNRELSIEVFHEVISPQSFQLSGSLTQKLLDEGLCFQTNLNNENETIQFTYDLVAGYAIASRVLINPNWKAREIKNKLIELGIEEKLFDKVNYHPLRQDILMSLMHLLPKKFGVQIFELFDIELVMEECFNNIDYFIDREEGLKKILEYLSSENKSNSNFQILIKRLFQNNFLKEIHGLTDFTIQVLSLLDQVEIDIYWSELIRKNRTKIFQYLEKLNKLYKRNKGNNENKEHDLRLCFLLTTSSNKSIRSIATENLFLIGKSQPLKILSLLESTLIFQDLNSLESITAALCGAIISYKSKEVTFSCLDFLNSHFIPHFESTHICIVDHVLTISEFYKSNFDPDYSNSIDFKCDHYNLEIDSDIKKNEDSYSPFPIGIDLYDFNKYQIRGIASDRYDKRETFPPKECLSIILSNVKRKGYKRSLFDSIDEDFYKDNYYRYSGVSTNKKLITYSEKYLWQSYLEFVGFLVLSGKLVSDYSTRFRCDYNFFDPTFPLLPKKFQLITNCFCPSESDNVQDWINLEEDNFINSFFINNLYTKDDWVLASLDISQKERSNNTRFHLTVDGFFIDANTVKDFEEVIYNGRFHQNSNRFHNLFAGEINWSDFSKTEENNYYYNKFSLRDLVYDYSWADWTEDRFENPNFKFLNTELADILNLNFNLDDLSYYTIKGEKVTNIIWAESSTLYYIRREIIEELKRKLNLDFIWYQFASKYGDYNDTNLKPSYKDLIKIIPLK